MNEPIKFYANFNTISWSKDLQLALPFLIRINIMTKMIISPSRKITPTSAPPIMAPVLVPAAPELLLPASVTSNGEDNQQIINVLCEDMGEG